MPHLRPTPVHLTAHPGPFVIRRTDTLCSGSRWLERKGKGWHRWWCRDTVDADVIVSLDDAARLACENSRGMDGRFNALFVEPAPLIVVVLKSSRHAPTHPVTASADDVCADAMDPKVTP